MTSKHKIFLQEIDGMIPTKIKEKINTTVTIKFTNKSGHLKPPVCSNNFNKKRNAHTGN